MAKKKSIKMNRKMKRSARRTVGILTLIMALIVAAIPTPSARAVGEDAGDGTGTSSVPVQTYPVSDNPNEYPTGMEKETIAPISIGSDRYSAIMIYQTSAGDYEMWNAYEFGLVNVSGSHTGVITDYNPVFQPQNGTLTINPNVVTNYPKFTGDEISAFFENNDTPLTELELKRYYAEEYTAAETTYNSEKADYEKAHDQWIRDGGTDASYPEPTFTKTFPADYIAHTAQELPFASKLSYFCDHYKETGNRNLESIHDQGYRLQEVTDKTVDSAPGTDGSISNTTVFIPFKEPEIPNNDVSTGFYGTGKYDIKYIGEKAFAGASNIDKIVIPSEILQIGDSAFEGADVVEVTAYAGTIGNRAFKNCGSLLQVEIDAGSTKVIGTECFYGCNRLSSIKFPRSVEKIGKGSFAYCAGLSSVDMSGIDQRLVIDDYAFYDCYSLNEVNFCDLTTKIGNAVFALESGINGSWTSVVLPPRVSELGEYVLSGRTNLTSVVMPEDYGKQKETTIGKGFFRNCSNLKYVEFPAVNGSCGHVTFDKTTFEDVQTPDFYIRGPEKNGAGNTASPRSSAWSSGITYVFNDNPTDPASGTDHWEVSSGTYRFAIDDNGVLTECILLDDEVFKNGVKDDTTGEYITPPGQIIIPANVGSMTVTGIGPECFSDEEIYKNLRILRIEDGGQVASIADNAFEGYPVLETVYIGNSINAIGNSAFKDCKKLTTVVFSTPAGGYGNFTIGSDAFATGGEKLTFYGDIVRDYAPFSWAMNPDNYMNKEKMIRVCYKSGTPEYPNLTVIRDNQSGYVTLVDYPHYDELPDSVKEKYENGTDADGNGMDALEYRLLQNVLHIVIPDGVESIDVSGYLKAENENGNNVRAYLLSSSDDRYYYDTYRREGLFNGYYGDDGKGAVDAREYPDNDGRELVAKGNDRILSVQMSSVKYLPDRAFESCENLDAVALGDAMEDVGTAPFTGCRNLASVGGNSKYTCNNGIIFAANDTGLTIVECLPSRGSVTGSPYVDSDSDTSIPNVTQIADGAFENCASIISVDLSNATKLTRIPDCCFKGDTNLIDVILPDTVRDIQEEAFADTRKYVTVTIPAKEVDIADDAFSEPAILRSYEGSAVEKYADRRGHTFKPIDDSYKVTFLDYDGTEISVQYVEEGRAAEEPEHPKRDDGYIFDTWSQSFSNVTSDLIVVAKYKWDTEKYPGTTPGMPGGPGRGTPTPTPNGTPTPTPNGTPAASGTPAAGSPTPTSAATNNSNQKFRLNVENGSGDGTYTAGTTVIITADTPPSGQRFDKWTSIANDFNITSVTSSITTITMPSHDLTIVANYTSGASAGTNGSDTNTNGNNTTISTNTNGNGNSSAGTTVDITKPGISDTGVASATVEGSTDNFVVKITDTAEARAAVEAALINEYGTLDGLRYFAMDISLYDSTGTNKIQDTSNLAVNITMPIPDELRQYAGNNQVAGVVNGNVLDKLSPRFTTINGVPCISFTATHFSPYTVYVDTSNLSQGVVDSTPKTGDPIHPKWFLAIGLACTSMILLLKKDKRQTNTKTA